MKKNTGIAVSSYDKENHLKMRHTCVHTLTLMEKKITNYPIYSN